MTRLELLLARVLRYGTGLASAIVALGLATGRARVVVLGIAGFIALPVVRVVLMLAAYVRARDVRYSLVAATVLMMIVLGAVLGSR